MSGRFRWIKEPVVWLFAGFVVVLVIAFIARPSDDGGLQLPEDIDFSRQVGSDYVRTNLSGTTWYPHVIEVVFAETGTIRVETDLFPEVENADMARTICEAVASSDLAENVMVRGQGGTSLWICNASGFSRQGSGYA